jgi:hypothetical protein
VSINNKRSELAKVLSPRSSICEAIPQGDVCSIVRRWRILSALILLGSVLRLYRLKGPFLRWDEGWSIGLSSLGWSEINRITALDVHPPLYYYLLKLWLGLGKDTFWLRYFSVWWGALAVPMAYVAGRRWAKSETIGLWAATYVTLAPFLVYYAQVTRMYSLAMVGCLGATYFALRAMDSHRTEDWIGFLASGAMALYTFYYSALVLAALLLYLVVTHHQRIGSIFISFMLLALLYLPWVIYAWPALIVRVGGRTSFHWTGTDILHFWRDGFYALVFAYGAGWKMVQLACGLLALGILLPLLRRRSAQELILPGLVIILSLEGISLGAKAHMFAPRYMIMASPFLGLGIAWTLAQLQELWWPLAFAAALGFGLVSFPTLSTAYAKPLEVVDPFDPHTFHRYVSDKARGQDLVFFNVLSTAGLYEHDRQLGDPPWSYALRWDPVIEALDLAIRERILPAARSHGRLWFVLYKGTYAHNHELKAWLDGHLYPAFAEWHQDSLYTLYVSPQEDLVSAPLEEARFTGSIELAGAAFTPRSSSGGEVAVRLDWQSTSRPDRDYKVFVHVYAPDGQLVAQHDAMPVNELRPTSGWRPGEEIADRHGIPLPSDVPAELQLAVGLYDPATGERVRLAGGEDRLVLGTIQVERK